MTATLVDSDTFAFADGNAGHSCDLGSAPTVGHWDVLCVNSDTVVSTPSGFTASVSEVTNQGAYIFTRKAVGGEASTVTVTTSGNFNALVSWSRWSGVDALDSAEGTQANSSATVVTPSHTTGTLAESGELVIAFAAIHSLQVPNPTDPVWSSGYTIVTNASQGSGGNGVVGFVAYKDGAGTAAETPGVSWTNAADDRYMLTLTITAGGASPTDYPVSGQIDATSTAALAITADRPASGIIAATSTAALAITAGRLVSGAIAATSGASLAITASRVVSGTIAAVSGASLALTGSAVVYVKRGGVAVLVTGLAGACKRGGVITPFGT